MPRALSIRITGIKELREQLGRISRSLETKAGIAARIGADIFVEEIRFHLDMVGGVDTFTLWKSIDKVQTDSYEWRVGEINNPRPYGIFVENGFIAHWIHIEQINPESRRMQEFVNRMDNDGFLEVGPMPPRPFFGPGISAGIPRWIENTKERLKEALRP